MIKNIIRKKFDNDLLYAYYKYLDRFKVNPVSLEDLFDFMDFADVDNKIKSYHRSIAEMRRGADGG